jgi:hypothetical protein
MQNSIDFIVENRMTETRKEIRINEYYTNDLTATYENNFDGESKPIERKSQLTTERYLSKLANFFYKEPKGEFELIPPSCRFLKSGNQGTVVVIEEAPAIRSIRVNKDMYNEAEALKSKGDWEKFGYENFLFENKRPYTFMLAIPFVVHIMLLKNNSWDIIQGKVFLNTRPLMGMADTLLLPPFLNIGGNINICFGEEVHNGPQAGLGRQIDHIIRTFWGATFNSDYIDHYLSYSEIPGVCDYFTWQYYTKTNPMFIYSADWIPYGPLGDVIKGMMQSRSFSPQIEATFGYKTLEDLFHKAEVSSESVKVGERTRTRQIVYDITSGMHFSSEIFGYIGDSFSYSKGKVAYIDCFIGVLGGIGCSHIRINLEGRFLKMRLTKKVKSFISEKIKELRYESKLIAPDGREFISGDIVAVTNRIGIKRFYKISYIRKALDGKLELRVGSSYWLADAYDWSQVEKISIDEPEIDGIKLNKNDDYFFYNQPHVTFSQILKSHPVKYMGITTGTSNNLLTEFQNTNNGERYTRRLESESSRTVILAKNDLKEIPYVFVCGRTLIGIYDDYGRTSKRVYKHPTHGIILNEHDSISKPETASAFNILLSPDKQHFHVETPDLTIDFSVGDKVICADWENPIEMLRIKTIIEFKESFSEDKIEFILKDKHENITKIQYVNVYRKRVLLGKVRKVTNEIDGIRVGTKIVAKETGICCFPKKVVNMIVTFIIDTGGEPLAFCSNGCTLWLSDLKEKFDLVPTSSPAWKTMKHCKLDPAKIKLQPGDIVNGVNVYYSVRGYLVAGSIGSGLRISRLDHYHEYDDYYGSDRNLIADLRLECIPNPRLSIPQQRDKGFIRAFPNFHGGLTESRFSPYLLINETGRF